MFMYVGIYTGELRYYSNDDEILLPCSVGVYLVIRVVHIMHVVCKLRVFLLILILLLHIHYIDNVQR